jgi:hypothetical protein
LRRVEADRDNGDCRKQHRKLYGREFQGHHHVLMGWQVAKSDW